MRLLLVSQDFPPDVGGIQTYAAELAPRLAAQARSFAALVPDHPAAAAVDAALAFPVHRLRARPDLLVLAALPALPRLAYRNRYDLAFHTQWQTVPASLVARRLTGYPRRIAVAAHARELLFNPFAPSLLQQAYAAFRRSMLARVDAFLPVSRYTAGLLQDLAVPQDRITVVHNGTDPHRFHPADASALRAALGLVGRRVLLTVGRLVPRKGVDTTLRALPRIASEIPEVVYLIAGEGPDRRRLEALAHRLGVADRVRFLNAVPYAALNEHYNVCDLFVMPSRAVPPDVEGFGIVFLEAAACGKPVVGARTGGIPDAIDAGETGLLVPPDDPAALARAVVRVLQNPALAAEMGRRGRRRVLDRATWDHIADQVYATLGDVCYDPGATV